MLIIDVICVSGVYGNVRAKMGRKEIICSWKKSTSNIKDVFEFKGKVGSSVPLMMKIGWRDSHLST